MNSGTFKSSPDFPFNFPSYEDWIEVARQELEGADPNEKLSLKKENLEIFAFYTADQKEKKSSPSLKASSSVVHSVLSTGSRNVAYFLA